MPGRNGIISLPVCDLTHQTVYHAQGMRALLKSRIRRPTDSEKSFSRVSEVAIGLRQLFTVHPQAQRLAIVIACNVNPFSDR